MASKFTLPAIDPNEFASLTSNAEQAYHTQGSGGKKPSFLESLLPSIGGFGGGALGGAAGGALAGSAILPGIGTAAGGLLGALLGGAAGGAAGKVAENKFSGQALGNGVAGQALEQGALSAGPLRLLKGASAGAKALTTGATAAEDAATQGGGRLVNALNAAGTAATAPGLASKTASAIANKGTQVEARAGGFGIGEKVAGKPALGYYDSAKIGKDLQAEGIPAGSPENRLKAVEDKLNTYGQQIDQHVAANNAPLTAAQKQAVVDNYQKSLTNTPGITSAGQKYASGLIEDFKNQVNTPADLVKFRRGVDSNLINFTKNPDAATTDRQIVARALRGTLSDATEQAAPGMSALNKSYSKLVNAKDFLVGANKAVSDQSQAGGGLVSRLLTNDTAQAAKSHLGSLMQKAAPDAAGGANPFGALPIAARTLPTGILQAAGQQAAQMAQPNTTSANIQSPNSASSSSINPSMTDLSQISPDSSSGNPSPFDPSQIEGNIQQILASGGTMKDAQDYVSLATAVNNLNQSGQKSPSLNATQIQQANNAQSALGDLQTIRDSISSDPSVLLKDSIPGGSLARRLTGTGNYDTAKQNVVDVIARLRSGAAISQDEANRYMSMLPTGADNQQVALQKIDRLGNLLSSFANPTATATALSSGDLASALGITQ